MRTNRNGERVIKGKKRAILVLAAFVALGTTFSLIVAGAAGSSEGPPPSVPWIRDDGTIDRSKTPDFFTIEDETGQIVTCPDGKPLQIPEEEFFAPPPPPPPAARLEEAAERGNVLVLERKPACGPNGSVRWIETWSEEPAIAAVPPSS